MRKAKSDAYRLFRTEELARAFVLDRLKDDFQFLEEVSAQDLVTKQEYRLDAVSVCEGTGHILGWEFKKSHLFKAEFAAALKQASDYRGARITILVGRVSKIRLWRPAFSFQTGMAFMTKARSSMRRKVMECACLHRIFVSAR